jgi:hypothetical protein
MVDEVPTGRSYAVESHIIVPFAWTLGVQNCSFDSVSSGGYETGCRDRRATSLDEPELSITETHVTYVRLPRARLWAQAL